MRLSPDGERIAYSGMQGGVEVREIAGPGRPRFVEEPPAFAFGFSWSPGGQYLAAYGNDPEGLRVHDLEAQQRLWIKEGLWGVSWSPDGTRILTSHMTAQSGQLVDAATGRSIRSIPGAWGPMWSPDSQRAIASYVANGRTRYKNLETTNWTCIAEISRDVNQGASISWSPDSRMLAFGVSPPAFGPPVGSLIVDAQSGKVLHRFRWYHTQVNAVAWSPGGDRVAFTHGTAESDGRVDVVNVHEVTSGRVVYRLVGPQTHILDLHWGGSTARIRGAAGDDDWITVWEWVLPAAAQP